MAGDLCTLLDYIINCGKYNKEDTLYSKYNSNLVNTFVINHQHVYADIDIELEESVTSKYHSSIVNQLLKLEYYKSNTDNAFINSILSNSFWMFIHQTLGSKDFITLFKTHLIVEFLEQDHYFVKIYGPPITLKSFTNKKKTQLRAYKKISIQSWLANTPLKSYHNYKLLINFKELEPFLDNAICKRLKGNHDNMAYLAVVNTTCVSKASLDCEVPNTLNCIIDKKSIMKYLKVITNKLFEDVFDLNGSKVLKPFVFKHLNTILNHGYNQFTTLSELKSELLEYLNKRKYTNDKHSLIYIVNWLFIHYYPCLMKYSFFGLTFTSNDDIVFYKHLDANYFISVKADLFIKTHFVPYNGCRKAAKTSENNTIIHDLSNGYYHCNLKPVLKNLKVLNNFRFLSVPDKLRTFNSYSKHVAFNLQYVKPTNKLLTHLRMEVLPEMYQKRHPTFKKDILVQNISEIMVHFNTFVTERKYRTVNKQKDLFYLKFDIKNSFDSVPLELLNTILSNIFKEVGLQRQFTLTKEDSISFSQTVNTSNKRSLEFKPITKLLIDKDVNTNPTKKLKSGNSNKDISLSNHIKIVQDVFKPKSLTIQEVKDITYKEMFQTITTNGKTCYERTRGLGQGMYLSPILSNIFYDDMVHTSTDLLPHKNDNKFFIRFMDDFLLIGENYMVLQKIKMKLLKNELFDKRFEVFVNTSKLELSKKCNQTFEFAGLEFDLAERSVRKKVETSMNVIKYSHVKSFKEIYNKLLVVLEIRLNGDCTMSLKSNSVEVIQRQVLHICENIFTMFTRYLKTVDKKKINMTEANHFHKFFFNVLNLFAAHLNSMNSFDHFNEKSFYRLKHLTESLDNIIALQSISNLKEVNNDKNTKFIEVLQKFLHI